MSAKGEFTIKQTQRVVNFVVSLCLLVTMAVLSPNVAYASSAAIGHQGSLRVDNKTQAKAASSDEAPFLWILADEPRTYITDKLRVREYDVHDLRMDTEVLWSWAWCAGTTSQLEENWNKINLNYEVDGKSVALHNFSPRDYELEIVVPGHGLQTGKCRMSYGDLYDLPVGDHELTVEAYFNEDVNDGWNVHPPGTIFRDVYRVTVISPVGIEHLGDAKYVCYFIEGSNGKQLVDQLGVKGPMGGRAWAEARWNNWDISGGFGHPYGTVDLSDVRVTVDPTITVPCWYPPADTIPAEIAKFDKFMRKIALHELEHVKIVQEHARILEQRLKDSNTRSVAVWDRIIGQVKAEESAAQDAFHASPEGQPIPYP
ncbi:MAG TPA: DUF922 domain-containing protein [Anaerolineales bacterium]|jgi:predicted secreted Zn-dependent protease|nr:DUF922 domain-containing protein [Anaerolineales bacterium]